MLGRRVLLSTTVFLLMLSGCAVTRGTQSASLPTVVLGGDGANTQPATMTAAASTRSSGLVVSGVVAPARRADLAFGQSGRVAEVLAARGDVVSAGEALVRLDDRAAQAELQRAQAALAAAEANHAAIAAGAADEELRQARAAVDGAVAALAALGAEPRAERVAQAEAKLVSAQSALAALTSGPTELALEAASVAIDQAKDALWAAQSTRDAVCGSRSLAGAECDAAEAQVLVAEGNVRQAEILLEQLQQEPDAHTVSQAAQAVRVAEAELDLARAPITTQELAAAQANVDAAEAALDMLAAQPRAEALASSAAQVAVARTQVDAATAALDMLVIEAPYAGTIVDVDVCAGEWVVLGQQGVTLADLDHLVVRTTDLSELDVPAVAVGQSVTVVVEALGARVAGHVTEISLEAGALGGDAVYEATVMLDGRPDGLRAGMTAEVAF